jgi:hypothetical protein
LANQQYTITNPSLTWTYTAFITTNPTLCTLTYTLTNSPSGTAYDSTVFTFSPASSSILIYSTDNTKVGTYTLKVTASDGATSNLKSFTFTVTVLN